jgi:Predicted membrane protein
MTLEVAVPARGRPYVPLALACAYPVVAHLAILSRNQTLIASSAGVLAVLVLWPGLRRGQPGSWLVFVGVIAALWYATSRDLATLPLFAPPVLITGFVAWLFGQSLRPGNVPLIEQIAQALREPTEPWTEELAHYARRLTVAWTLLTGSLAVINLGLALLAEPGGLLLTAGLRPPVTVPLSLWSIFANLVVYVVLGAMFAVEYAWRRYRFPQQRGRGFVDFIGRLVRLGPVIARARAPAEREPADRLT